MSRRIIGLTGVHRSGKTTLAREYANRNRRWTFVPCRTQHHASNLATSDIGLEERLYIQRRILLGHMEDLGNALGDLVTDRTPIDFMAYMLCEIGMLSNPLLSKEVMAFTRECEQATVEFDYLVRLDALGTYHTESGKPAENPAYSHHFNMVMSGLLENQAGCREIFTLDLEERLHQMRKWFP